MDYLHPFFEKQLEFRQDNEGNIVIGDTVFSPVAILRKDEDAYKNEFLNWLNEKWLPEQHEIIEEILAFHSNRKRYIDLCAALKNGYLIPFVGSGMSIPTGLLSWSDFLRDLRNHSLMTEEALEDLLSEWKYEDAAEQLAAAMPERLFDECIEHKLRIDDPDKICGAVIFLPHIFNNLVLTTNLDDLLELLYDIRGCQFSHILRGFEISKYRQIRANSERMLLKFHGDCRKREGRVLGRTEYDITYASNSPVREELSMIYRNNSLLFIGCSLNPDRTVGLLGEVAKFDQGMPKHYAFLQHSNNSKLLQQREYFLINHDIFPIWYSGDHDESIQALLVGMLRFLGKL